MGNKAYAHTHITSTSQPIADSLIVFFCVGYAGDS